MYLTLSSERCGNWQVMSTTDPLLLQQQQLQQLMIQIGQHHMQHGATMFNPFLPKTVPDSGGRSFSRASSMPLSEQGSESRDAWLTPQVAAAPLIKHPLSR